MSKKKKTERESLEFYLGLKYPVTFYPDPDGGYVAEIKDLPGCMTQGETADEVMSNIEEARSLWIETAYEHGDEIPLPSTETQYSGRVLLRMPRSLHQQLVENAEREGVSFNQYIVSLLSERNALRDINPIKKQLDTIYNAIHGQRAATLSEQLLEALTTIESTQLDYELYQKTLVKLLIDDSVTRKSLLRKLKKYEYPGAESASSRLLRWLLILPDFTPSSLDLLLAHKVDIKQLIEYKTAFESKAKEIVEKVEVDKEEVKQ